MLYFIIYVLEVLLTNAALPNAQYVPKNIERSPDVEHQKYNQKY